MGCGEGGGGGAEGSRGQLRPRLCRFLPLFLAPFAADFHHLRMSCLPMYVRPPQERAEVVETPTMVHIMGGQNNLLQRTGFRGGETELED